MHRSSVPQCANHAEGHLKTADVSKRTPSQVSRQAPVGGGGGGGPGCFWQHALSRVRPCPDWSMHQPWARFGLAGQQSQHARSQDEKVPQKVTSPRVHTRLGQGITDDKLEKDKT